MNSVSHRTRYSPPRRSPAKWGLIQHQNYRMISVARVECERDRMTHRSRDFVMLVDASPNANPERDKTENKENHANSKAACFQSHSPQSGHECVNGEKLVRCVSVVAPGSKNIMRARRTRMLKPTPTSPNCWITPCAVQYGPVATIPL
jgi:hypothetical protein